MCGGERGGRGRGRGGRQGREGGAIDDGVQLVVEEKNEYQL